MNTARLSYGAIVAAMALAQPAAGDGRALGPMLAPPPVGEFFPHPERVLVRFAPGAPEASVAAALDAAGVLETMYRYQLVPGLRCVRVAPGSVERAVAVLAGETAVLYAHPDSVGFITAQLRGYGIDLVMAPPVWPVGAGTGVRVAVLDTGLSTGHPDLPAPIATQSFVAGESAEDAHGHGTHCAGIVLARDNDLGVVGVAPQADLLVGKVCNNDGSFCATGDALAGIDWAVANGSRVITMSFSVDDAPTQAFEDTCAAALAAGTLLIAAAGNSGNTTFYYPASYASVMAVAAVDSTSTRASFSTTGPHVSVAAPGVAVPSTYRLSATGQIAGATWGGTGHAASAMTNSAPGDVTAQIIDCGTCNTAGSIPPAVAGRIAHCRRGGGTFAAKTTNAAAAGAIGVIISNNAPGAFQGSLGASPPPIPAVGVSGTDGDFLVANSGIVGGVQVLALAGYQTLSGTSMAAPHVAGAAATLLSGYAIGQVAPGLLRTALESTAQDLGAPGRDDEYGHGLINLVAAKAYLDDALAPSCTADFNADGNLDPDDLSDYITCFFSSPACAGADFNQDANTDPDDLSDYITAFFQGCP